MIPTAVPSTIAMDNYRTAFAMNSSKPAIMVAVADAHVDILCERGHCNAQSHNRRNNKKTAPHCTISSLMPLESRQFINAAPCGKFQRLLGEVCASFARGI
jgi:hypothetical protein